MAYEILKSIVESEEQAIKMKEAAEIEVKELLEAAEKQKMILLAQIQQEGKDLMKTATKEAVEKSRAEIQIIQKDTEEHCQKIKMKAAEKKEEAIQAVMGKVVGTYGSC